MRVHRLFRDHPDARVTLPWGSAFRLPFHCYDAETLVIAGTVALEPLRTLLAPEGLVPVEVGGRGAAQLWINHYRDTNAGPYKELVIGFSASDRPISVPRRGAASPLAPLADARCVTFVRWLFLDVQHPVDLGREVWGFPKERGEVVIDEVNGGWHHRVSDAAGRAVVDLRVRRLGGRARWALGGLHAVRAMGRQALELARSPEITVDVVTPRDVKASRVTGKLVGTPYLYRWKDEIRWDGASPCGQTLIGLGFEPTIVQRYDPLRFVLLVDEATLEVAVAS